MPVVCERAIFLSRKPDNSIELANEFTCKVITTPRIPLTGGKVERAA